MEGLTERLLVAVETVSTGRLEGSTLTVSMTLSALTDSTSFRRPTASLVGAGSLVEAQTGVVPSSVESHIEMGAPMSQMFAPVGTFRLTAANYHSRTGSATNGLCCRVDLLRFEARSHDGGSACCNVEVRSLAQL